MSHFPQVATTPSPETTQTITLPTVDANGRLAHQNYVLDQTIAYIDPQPRPGSNWDPLHADSYGLGVLVADAQAKGAQTIVLSLSKLADVASFDAGMGLLVALGAAPHDSRGFALPKGAAPLINLDRIDTATLNIPAACLNWVLVIDDGESLSPAQAPAASMGEDGLTKEQAALLTGAMMRVCDVMNLDPATPGLGAGGGIPLSLKWLSTTMFGDDSHFEIRH